MTPEEQRIAIAEACGYTNVHTDRLGFLVADLKDDHFGIPDYLNDLNAMHEAEKVLDIIRRQLYVNELLDMSDTPSGVSEYEVCAFATAAQRAEAFLKCLGKWTETDASNLSMVESNTAQP